MKVQLDKRYPMPCAAQVAWEFLQDLEAVAACMPGAKVTEKLDAGRYKGTVTARVGPATMSFRGEVEMKDLDPATRSLRLVGKGTDSTGSSGASMNLTASIEASEANRCTLVGASEVSMSGKAVAFGGRMMNAVAEQILKQFADNFALKVAALQAQSDAVPASAGSAAAAPGTVPAPPQVAENLDGLALVWTIFKEWLRGLWPKKPSS
ncbi:MAG: SRPBCC family protein [Burkholderiaceae bacterium]